MFLRLFQHLLPNAKAWRLTVDKQLRQFFNGLTGIGSAFKSFVDLIWLDVFPKTTREISKWETEFGLQDSGINEQQRRDRLDATWKALGGQDPKYIQDTLQANGFDVYVHEWWEPGTEPDPGIKQCVTPRNPLLYIRREFAVVSLLVECGEPDAQCGEAFAQCGNSVDPKGYPLVNKIFETSPDIIPTCGEAIALCGEAEAICGNFIQFIETLKEYIVSNDPAKWPYFLYIGGSTFGDMATVDPKRKNEFEALCLKISPTQQWLAMLVEYS